MTTRKDLTIEIVHTHQEIEVVRRLFREYAHSLPIDLTFQDFENELAFLSGYYQAPAGDLLLAHVKSHPAGVVGFRALERGICEMKRLYVQPAFRRLGIGKALAVRVIDETKKRGYRIIRLDTLTSMDAANFLYRELHFSPIPAYYANPYVNVIYYERQL